MKLASAIVLVLVTAAATAGALQVTGADAGSRATHIFYLQEGDTAVLNRARVKCTAFNEGGAPELYCRKSAGGPAHQVSFFRNQIAVWANGNPDTPVWSGKP